MRWWGESDPRFGSWKEYPGTTREEPCDKRVLEICFAQCATCNAELIAEIVFEHVTAVEIRRLRLETSA
jgi:hypothetical protein